MALAVLLATGVLASGCQKRARPLTAAQVVSKEIGQKHPCDQKEADEKGCSCHPRL